MAKTPRPRTDINRSAILAHLGAQGPTSRADLARMLGMSPASVTQLARDLIDPVEEVRRQEQAGERVAGGVLVRQPLLGSQGAIEPRDPLALLLREGPAEGAPGEVPERRDVGGLGVEAVLLDLADLLGDDPELVLDRLQALVGDPHAAGLGEVDLGEPVTLLLGECGEVGDVPVRHHVHLERPARRGRHVRRPVLAGGDHPYLRLPLGGESGDCPLIKPDGGCSIYADRPFGCRTYFCGDATLPDGHPRREIDRLSKELRTLSEQSGERDLLPLTTWLDRSFDKDGRRKRSR